MMPWICAEVSRGAMASISAATPHTYGLAMLVPVISIHGRVRSKPRGGDDVGAVGADVGLEAAVARRARGSR